ncbi:MAG: nuclease-related domain-containing protein [Bacillota bacterium]|nr:nuclease-related domain-containing protein [Bacillota bacterium]
MSRLIVKRREPSPINRKIEALSRRIKRNHPKAPLIEKENRIRKAGDAGEKAADYHMRKLPDKNYYIFQGLRLLNDEEPFQIDTLLFTPNFGMPVEVKNIAGILHFDKKHSQFTRTLNGNVERFKNPILQVQRQRDELKQWVAKFDFLNIPLDYLFVNSNEKAIITADPHYDLVYRHSCNSDILLNKIIELSNIYKKELLSPKEIRKLNRLLLKHHTPEDKDILQFFHLTPEDVMTGVQCPNCQSIPMKYQHGIWICQTCLGKSADAHLKAIEDYFLLIKPSITNSELKAFLHMPTSHAAYRILSSLKLNFTGKYRNRTYHKNSSGIFTSF